MGEQVIVLTDLTKKYGNFTAVDHISLSICKGEIFGLLGPNGAGKSTTILMMLGLTEPTSGKVEICGIDSTTNPIEVKRKIGYLPEDLGFYDDMTGLENLIYTALLNGFSRKEAEEKAKELMRRVGLAEQVNKKTGKYSRGMRQRLGLADVLIKNPEIIILDEPTAGLDPKGRDDILDQIAELHKVRGITIILVSHSMEDIAKYAERLIVVNDGEIAYDDAPKAVFAHYRELEAMGLAAPQITYIMHALKEKGLDVDVTATTVEEAKENILAVLKKTAPEKLLRTDEKENKGGQEA